MRRLVIDADGVKFDIPLARILVLTTLDVGKGGEIRMASRHVISASALVRVVGEKYSQDAKEVGE